MDHQVNKNKLYRFTLSKVLTLTLLALLIAAILISVTNDLYAFVKKDTPLSLTLSDPLPLEQLCELLAREGIVHHPTVFRWYVVRKGKRDALEQFRGVIDLNTSMSYRELLVAFLS